MSSYTDVVGLRSAILAITAAAVSDLGNQLVTLEPIPKKREWLASYIYDAGTKEIRGIHVMPGSPFHGLSREAVGYTWTNRWKWDVFVFRSAERDATARDAALQRACDMLDALRKTDDLSAYGVAVINPPLVELRGHGYSMLSNVGVWTTDISTTWDVSVTEPTV